MTLPIIAITNVERSQPAWLEAVQATIGKTYQIEPYKERAGYVSRLVDQQAALILVHGVEDWVFWTATPKSSPATRRIPIFLIAEPLPPHALASGANLALTPDELLSSLDSLITEFARIPDATQVERLRDECRQTLPPLAIQGIEQFNAGAYYKQHDLFEALWMQTKGPVRDLYRAILQVGVAYYQIKRGNHRGARKMLQRSAQWLAILPDECQGVDVRALREDSYRVRVALEALPEDQIDQFDLSVLQPVKMAQRM